MTNEEARAWVAARCSAEAMRQLERFADLVITETAHQNLIAPSTIPEIWNRHIADSAQLLDLSGDNGEGMWLDIGSGAGFPGLVIACLSDRPVMLVEPRARRAAFLTIAAGSLGLSAQVTVKSCKVAAISASAAVISARAVAPLEDLFAMAHQCATDDTYWLLPKGKTAREEVARAKRTWHGTFHVEHSVTDPDALIVVASKVTRR